MIHVAGAVSVDAVLKGGNRSIDRIVVGPKRPKRILAILEESELRRVPVEEVSELELEAIDPRHAGVIAEVGERVFSAPDELWSADTPFLAHLDGVEDPYNFGQAVRTLYAAGCAGVLVGERNWMTATTVVTRASAGATELMPMAVQPAADAVAEAARRGAAVIATSDRAESDIHEVDLTGTVLVLFGGERRGVTRSVLGDVRAVRIPYGRQFPRSLGTVAATSVVAFEVLRQRRTDRGQGIEERG